MKKLSSLVVAVGLSLVPVVALAQMQPDAGAAHTGHHATTGTPAAGHHSTTTTSTTTTTTTTTPPAGHHTTHTPTPAPAHPAH